MYILDAPYVLSFISQVSETPTLHVSSLLIRKVVNVAISKGAVVNFK